MPVPRRRPESRSTSSAIGGSEEQQDLPRGVPNPRKRAPKPRSTTPLWHGAPWCGSNASSNLWISASFCFVCGMKLFLCHASVPRLADFHSPITSGWRAQISVSLGEFTWEREGGLTASGVVPRCGSSLMCHPGCVSEETRPRTRGAPGASRSWSCSPGLRMPSPAARYSEETRTHRTLFPRSPGCVALGRLRSRVIPRITPVPRDPGQSSSVEASSDKSGQSQPSEVPGPNSIDAAANPSVAWMRSAIARCVRRVVMRSRCRKMMGRGLRPPPLSHSRPSSSSDRQGHRFSPQERRPHL